MDNLHREMRCWPVKYCHSAVVSAWRVCSNDAVPIRPAGADSVSNIGFLKDAQGYVGLVRPPSALTLIPCYVRYE